MVSNTQEDNTSINMTCSCLKKDLAWGWVADEEEAGFMTTGQGLFM
jgi:hypothetical protein